jgi:hypothetical protein
MCAPLLVNRACVCNAEGFVSRTLCAGDVGFDDATPWLGWLGWTPFSGWNVVQMWRTPVARWFVDRVDAADHGKVPR